MFRLELLFSGLTSEYRISVFKQIHEIVFHGNGGYDWNTIYHMPIWLRNFTYQQLVEHYEKQNNTNSQGKTVVEQNRETLQQSGFTSNNKNVDNQVQVPTYVTNASKGKKS